jgi:hypothetical protein
MQGTKSSFVIIHHVIKLKDKDTNQ